MFKLAMLFNRSCVTFARVELLKSFPESTKKTDAVLVLRTWSTLPNKLWSGLKCLRTDEEVALPSIHHTRATEDTPLVDWRLWQRRSAYLSARLNFLSDWPSVSPEPCGCDVQTRPPLTGLQPSCVRFTERGARCIQFPGQIISSPQTCREFDSFP